MEVEGETEGNVVEFRKKNERERTDLKQEEEIQENKKRKTIMF